MPYTDEEKKRAEMSKFVHDYFKHLTTLSTGAIIIIVAFLEKLFSQPKWKALVGVGIVAFLMSVVSSVVVQTYTMETLYEAKTSTWFRRSAAIAIIVAWLSF